MALTVAEMLTTLPAPFKIIYDSDGLPIRVEKMGRSFPAFTVGLDLEAAELRTDPDLERLLSQGMPGVVVLDGDIVVGVVTATDLVELGRPRARRNYREGDSLDVALFSEPRAARRLLLPCGSLRHGGLCGLAYP